MQYTKPKFSVAMPGAGVDWPFDDGPDDERVQRTYWYEECPACKAFVSTCSADFLPAHEHSADAGRPRRRVCFGR